MKIGAIHLNILWCHFFCWKNIHVHLLEQLFDLFDQISLTTDADSFFLVHWLLQRQDENWSYKNMTDLLKKNTLAYFVAIIRLIWSDNFPYRYGYTWKRSLVHRVLQRQDETWRYINMMTNLLEKNIHWHMFWTIFQLIWWKNFIYRYRDMYFYSNRPSAATLGEK